MNIEITVNPEKPFVAFTHSIYGKLTYCESGTLIDAFNFNRYREQLSDPEMPSFPINVQIMGQFADLSAAKELADSIIRTMLPRQRLTRMNVKCVETGVVYATATAAAAAIGVSKAAVTNHLNGVAGFGAVKTLHFVRTTQPVTLQR